MDEEDSSMFDRIKDLPMLKSSQIHSSLRLDEENAGGQPPVSLGVHNSVSLTGGASASRDITPKHAFINHQLYVNSNYNSICQLSLVNNFPDIHCKRFLSYSCMFS